MRRKVLIVTALMLVLYTLGYGVARWRKFIVMKEYDAKDQRLLIRRTGPGWDVRDTQRGHLKNSLNPVAYFCFRPFCFVEDSVRGFSRPLRTTPNKSVQATAAAPFILSAAGDSLLPAFVVAQVTAAVPDLVR